MFTDCRTTKALTSSPLRRLGKPCATYGPGGRYVSTLLRECCSGSGFANNGHSKAASISGFESLISALSLPDRTIGTYWPAALHARAELIITINLKDFSAAALSPHSIVAANPDAFVDDLFDLDERAAIAAIAKMRSRLRAPSLSPADFVDSIHARIPVVLVPVRPAYST